MCLSSLFLIVKFIVAWLCTGRDSVLKQYIKFHWWSIYFASQRRAVRKIVSTFEVGEFKSSVNRMSVYTTNIGLLIGVGIKCHTVLNTVNVVRSVNFLFNRSILFIYVYSWPNHTWPSIAQIFLNICRDFRLSQFYRTWKQSFIDC